MNNNTLGGLALVLVIIVVWMMLEGRPLFRGTGFDTHNTAADVNAAVQDIGHDLQSAGRSAADTIRNAVRNNAQ